MIQVEHLTKLYGPKTAIADVSFSVDKGEVLAFLGPNGAGKTTTMRILTASLPATSGSAKVAGYDCFDQPTEVKRLIGYLPEVPPLYTEMTVTEYLTFVGRIKGIEPERLPVALDQILERLSLGEVRGRLIANLSRGFQQRVGPGFLTCVPASEVLFDRSGSLSVLGAFDEARRHLPLPR